MSVGRMGLVQAGSPDKQCPTLAELTADATATASQIAEGATAYVQGEKITGTMPTTIDVGIEKIRFGYSTFEVVPSYFDFSSKTDGSNMFYNCSSVTSFAGLDFSSIINGANMFYNCSSVTSFAGSDFSSIINGAYMFYNCSSVTSFAGSDFSSITNGGDMFHGCRSVTSFAGSDFSSLTNGQAIFAYCLAVTSFAGLNFPLLTNARSMFYGCSSLTEFNENLLNITNTTQMFYECENISKISNLNFQNVSEANNMFYGCSALTFFQNTSTISCSLSFADSPLLNPSDAESSILEMLADLTGKTSQTITFNTALQSSISESAIQAATDKNWVVNFADSI